MKTMLEIRLVGICLIFGLLLSLQVFGQSNLCVLDNIKGLESAKDPKCHATANRLEDFMYGTPLEMEAREKKVELQKKLILFIWDLATKKCQANNIDTINTSLLASIIDPLCDFGKLKNGQWFFRLGENIVTIEANDIRQYSTVAYSLRAMLSVEQDFLFNPSWNLLPMTYETVNNIKNFIDLASLAAIQLSDKYAREEDSKVVSSKHLEKAWNHIFKKSESKPFLVSNYPSLKVDAPEDQNYSTIRGIIAQKIESYSIYNEISLPILLRNIQVYFARHRWPADQDQSNELKNYLIESLVVLSQDIITKADLLADDEGEKFIRGSHLRKTADSYLPMTINQFEDVSYFPNLEDGITIESYDLDAFRDSGLHWKILEYGLQGLDPRSISELDPFAAEILVETMAQWALLVLRVTGDISVNSGNDVITLKDMENAFLHIQDLIYKSALTENGNPEENKITSSNSESIKEKVFFDETEKIGIDFYHKSADWLSRLIRSYVIKKDENLIRMAIPPAFGGSGVAAEDINNDGYMDVLLLGGMGNKLYLNNKKGGFTDITKEAGINIWDEKRQSYAEVRQCIIVDFDNDGMQDIFLTLVDDNHKLFRNTNGQNFEDVSNDSGFDGAGKVGGPATAFDYDNDGLLDIYIGYFGNYLNGDLPTLDRNNQNGSKNSLYKNLGNLTFKEVDHISNEDQDYGWTQALVHLDINQDGLQDIIVGNDFGINAYYLNNGDGTFTNNNKALGTDKPSYTMSIGSADLNQDFLPDLYISNIVVMEKDEKYVSPTGDTKMNFDPQKMENIRTVEANDLFISSGGSTDKKFYSKSDEIGRGYSSTGWSWDADFFDFDNDGDEDLYCLNGMNDFRVYGAENPYYSSPDGSSKNVIYAQSNKEKNVFFVNEGGKLSEKSKIIGGDIESNSRSAAYFDLENDGDLDIIINNYHDRATFLENKQKNENNWIKIKLKGSPKNKINLDAIGSSIIIKNVKNDLQVWREIHSTTGYLSVHPKIQHFGVRNCKDVDVSIKWSNGETVEYSGLKTNMNYLIEYGMNPILQ